MRRFLAGVLSALVVLAACGDDGGSASADPDATLEVAATTTVLAEFATTVGGDRVNVYSMIRPNVDAHDYEPSPRDINALRSADVIVKNGFGLETWLDRAITSSGTAATVVDTSQGVTARENDDDHGHGHKDDDGHGHKDDDDGHDHKDDDDGHGHKDEDVALRSGSGHGHDHDEYDPHIWHDPRNAVVMVQNIAQAFAEADPAGRDLYEANAAAYIAEIEALDAELEARFASLTNRKIVTNHDAFGYLIDRYGLEYVGAVIPSSDSSAEVSASAINALVAEIRAQGVKAVFAERTLPADLARAISREAGVTVVEGDDALYGDGLGAPGSTAGTYLGMMRHNAETIISHLS